MQAIIKLYGAVKCPKAYQIRDFLQRNRINFQWFEITDSRDASHYTDLRHLSNPKFPCLTVGSKMLYAPTLSEIVHAIGWESTPSKQEYDLAIYGAGPAGLSAAVYAASEGLRTVLIERYAIGGQAGSTSRIENYLGFPDGISGSELASRARDQALRLGAEILLAAECMEGESDENGLIGILDSGKRVRSRAAICATGVEYTRLDLMNEDRLLGRGLYYGAGASEVTLCGGAPVYVVGGGNSAGQTALHLAGRSSKVTMLVRGESLKHTLSQYLIDRILLTPNIEVRLCCRLTAIEGDRHLERIRFGSVKTTDEIEVEAGWVFVCVGGRPRTDLASDGRFAVDSAGYLLTGMDLLQHREVQWLLERHPYPMETSIPGLFAAGDIRSNSIKRCATAVGEGAAAVAAVHRYLSGID